VRSRGIDAVAWGTSIALDCRAAGGGIRAPGADGGIAAGCGLGALEQAPRTTRRIGKMSREIMTTE
jgi:hypothetical protein